MWIAEDERHDGDGRILLGTFSGYLDGGDREERFGGLPVDEAIAWGRARAERINIRLGTGDYHSAGAEHSRAYPRWPPPDLPPLVERRPPEEAWKDRGASDEPIAWRAAVWLTPPWTSEDAAATRASWELTVSEVASAAGADRWDGEEMAGFLEDLAQASRETAGASISWASYHRPSYRIWFCERAASAALASEQARRRCCAPENWDVE